MRRPAAILGLTALGAFEAATIAALHALGRLSFLQIDVAHLADWATRTPAVDSIASIGRIAGLGVAYAIAAVTIAEVVARARRRKLPSPLTIPLVRRFVDAALAVTITTMLATPAVAAVGGDGSHGESAGLQSAVPPGRVLPPGCTAVGYSTAAPAPAAASHVVEPGDSLWSISLAHLELVGGSQPGARLVWRHWRDVVAANRHLIRSGDPDLIFPGEVVVLPPVQGT